MSFLVVSNFLAVVRLDLKAYRLVYLVGTGSYFLNHFFGPALELSQYQILLTETGWFGRYTAIADA